MALTEDRKRLLRERVMGGSSGPSEERKAELRQRVMGATTGPSEERKAELRAKVMGGTPAPEVLKGKEARAYLPPHLAAAKGTEAPPGMPRKTARQIGQKSGRDYEFPVPEPKDAIRSSYESPLTSAVGPEGERSTLTGRPVPAVVPRKRPSVSQDIAEGLLSVNQIAEGFAKLGIDMAKAVPEAVGGAAQRTLQYPAQLLGKAGVYGAKPAGEFLERESEGAARRLGLSAVPAAAEEWMKPPEKRDPLRPEFREGLINEVPGAMLGGLAHVGKRVLSGESLRGAIERPGQSIVSLLEHAAFAQPFAANVAPSSAAARAIVGARPLAKTEGVPQTWTQIKDAGWRGAGQRLLGEVGGLGAAGEGNLMVAPARGILKVVEKAGEINPWTRKWLMSPERQRAAAVAEARKWASEKPTPGPGPVTPKATPTIQDLPVSLQTKGKPIAEVRAHLDLDTADLANRLRPILAEAPEIGEIIVKVRERGAPAIPKFKPTIGGFMTGQKAGIKGKVKAPIKADLKFGPGIDLKKAQGRVRTASKGKKVEVSVVASTPELQALVDNVLETTYPHSVPRTWADQFELLNILRHPEQWSVEYGNALRKRGVPVGDMADMLAHRITMRGMKREGLGKTPAHELPELAVHGPRLSELVDSLKAKRQEHIQAITPGNVEALRKRLFDEHLPPEMEAAYHKFTPSQQDALVLAAEDPTKVGLFPEMQIKTYTGNPAGTFKLWKVDPETGKYKALNPGEYSAKYVKAMRAAMTSEGGLPPRIEVKYRPNPAAIYDPRITPDVLKWAEAHETTKATLRAQDMLRLPEEQHTSLLPNPAHTKRMYEEYLTGRPGSQGPYRGYTQMTRKIESKIDKLIEKGKLHVSEGKDQFLLRRDQEIGELIGDKVASDVGFHLAAEMKYIRSKVPGNETPKGWVKVRYGEMVPEYRDMIRNTLGDAADSPHLPAMVNELEHMGVSNPLANYNWGSFQPIYDLFVKVKTSLNPAMQVRNETSLFALHEDAAIQNRFPSLVDKPLYFWKTLREGYQSGKNGGRMGDVQHYLHNLGLKQQGKPYSFRKYKDTGGSVDELLGELVPNFESVYNASGAAQQIKFLGDDLAKNPPKNLGGLMDTLAIWPRALSYSVEPARLLEKVPCLRGAGKKAGEIADAATLHNSRVYSYGMTSDLVFKYVHARHRMREFGESPAEAARVVHNQFQNSHIQALLPRLITKFIPFFTWSTFSFGKIPKMVAANPTKSLALIALAQAEEERVAREAGMTPAQLRQGEPWYLQSMPIIGTYEEGGQTKPIFSRMSPRLPGGIAEGLAEDFIYPGMTLLDAAARNLANPILTLFGTVASGTNPVSKRTLRPYESPTALGVTDTLGAKLGNAAYNVAKIVDPVAQTLMPAITYQMATEVIPKLLGYEGYNYGGVKTTAAEAFGRAWYGGTAVRANPDMEQLNAVNRLLGSMSDEDRMFGMGLQRMPSQGETQGKLYEHRLLDSIDRNALERYFPQEENYVPWKGPLQPSTVPMLKPGQKWFK